jgi:hypothetical protein
MQAQLIFNLPEDQMEFDLAVNGSKWNLAMWDLNQHLRSQTKHAPDSMSDDTHKALEDTRAKIFEILNEHGLKLD